jgi:hypothetical protein
MLTIHWISSWVLSRCWNPTKQISSTNNTLRGPRYPVTEIFGGIHIDALKRRDPVHLDNRSYAIESEVLRLPRYTDV